MEYFQAWDGYEHPALPVYLVALLFAFIGSIIVDRLGVDESEVTPHASFVEDLNADSLALAELIMSFEQEFNVEISDEDAEYLTTVEEMHVYLIGRDAMR